MTTSVSISPSEIGAVMPPALQTMTSGTTIPSGSSRSSEAAKQYAEWSDTVLSRWNQVQEIGIGSGSNLVDMDESGRTANSGSSPLNGESWHGSLNPAQSNHTFNMSMAAVAEEPEERSNALSQPSQSYHTTMASSSAATIPAKNNPPWKRLEEQVKRQEECIQQLQETVQRQETSIRQDLQQLMQMVSNLAANAMNHQRDIAVGVLDTPNAAETNPQPKAGPPQTPPASTTELETPKRPSMYRKSDHHPANIFTSVRTIERKPPKPPMRHGSFSTHAESRRQSVGSASHLASIISSLGNSTMNDATTYNDTTTHNTATKSEEDEDPAPLQTDGFGPGLESLLERAKNKPLEIIFDASGRINSDFLHAKEEDDEEKKSATSNGSPNDRASPPAIRQTMSNTSSDRPKRDSFQKSPGSIRLSIPVDEASADRNPINSLEMPVPPRLRSRSASPLSTTKPPPRIQRKMTPPFQSGSANRPLRQPRRELSVTDVTTEKAGNQKEIYVPPAPPPPTPSNNVQRSSADDTRQGSAMGRLHPASLAKLGASTAPPRREIFASGGSALQISCLTIDTTLLANDSELNLQAALKYREVINLAVTDKFGDKGVYTGELSVHKYMKIVT